MMIRTFPHYRELSSRLTKGERRRAVKDIMSADTPKEFHLHIAGGKKPE
jgi:hypothetical protein